MIYRGFRTLLLLGYLSTNLSFGTTLTQTHSVGLSAAHGMVITTSGELLLADTYKIQGTPSFLYNLLGQRAYEKEMAGVGLAGISRTSDGFLVCDAEGSKVYRTDQKFRVIEHWDITTPWNARVNPRGQIFAITYSGDFAQLLPNGLIKVLISNLDATFDFAFPAQENEVWISEQGVKAGRVSLWRLSENQYQRVLDSDFAWANPEGLTYFDGSVWVLDTELGQLVRIESDGKSSVQLKDLGIPILIDHFASKLYIYSNQYNGNPSLLEVSP